MTTELSIGFIGAGNMASALAGGMIANGINAQSIMLSDINDSQLLQLKNELGVQTTTNNKTLIEKNRIIVLALKPQVMQQVMAPLASAFQKSQPLIISIAAGITVDSLETWTSKGLSTNEGLPIIRCMPNTPALVKCGASGLFANEKVNDEQKKQAQSILEAVGIVRWLDAEKQIDAVTALSGSGPAYYFLMIESMIAAGIEQGLSKEVATALTLQTALGSSKMASISDVDIGELRKRVTSPKGTTEAAINNFLNNAFKNNVKSAMDAAYHRSIELSKES